MSALGPLTRAQVALGKNADAQRGAEESISLGHSFGELGLALQGAAAVAMHLGDAEQALVLSEQVLARHHAMGASDAEAIVVRSLALSQLGRIDEALAAIEGVDVDDFPFGRSARALVRALADDPEGAQADAEAVEGAPGASYFDRSVACLGGVVASLRTDDAVRRRHWFEQLRAIATSAGDTVFLGLTQALAREPASVPESLGSGWKKIVEQATADGRTDTLGIAPDVFGGGFGGQSLLAEPPNAGRSGSAGRPAEMLRCGRRPPHRARATTSGCRSKGRQAGISSPKLMPSSRAVSIESQSSGTDFIRCVASERGT